MHHMNVPLLHTVYLWLAALVTLGIYTFLYSDNKLYRIILNVMIGMGAGYGFIIAWKQALGPLWWDKMIAGFAALFAHVPGRGFATMFSLKPGLGFSAFFAHRPGWEGSLWVFAAFLGILWYFQFSRKYMWLSRIVIGMTLGMGAGIVFKAQFLLNMPQITDSLRPLIAKAPDVANFPAYPNGIPLSVASGPVNILAGMVTSFNNILYVATIVAVMVYFFFSFSHDNKAIAGTAKFGRWMLMISFGAFFGNTVMTRMGVFLQRLEFLSKDWGPRQVDWGIFKADSWLVALILGVVALAVYIVYYFTRPPKPQIPDGEGPVSA
jgi:hypothetical protein